MAFRGVWAALRFSGRLIQKAKEPEVKHIIIGFRARGGRPVEEGSSSRM